MHVWCVGLSHSCSSAWFGSVCELILNSFASHRYKEDAYYTGINWGDVLIDWEKKSIDLVARDYNGKAVLKSNRSFAVPIPYKPHPLEFGDAMQNRSGLAMLVVFGIRITIWVLQKLCNGRKQRKRVWRDFWLIFVQWIIYCIRKIRFYEQNQAELSCTHLPPLLQHDTEQRSRW